MSGSPRGLHRLAVFTAAATCFLIFAGGLVTSTGSGLAVPDWPLSYGTLFPPMIGGIFYEHGHRLVAGAVALLTAGLALWAWRREPSRGIRVLAVAALTAILAQAGLGGMTVLLLLPTVVSVAHAALANLYFCLVIGLSFATSAAASPAAGRDAATEAPGLRPGWAVLTACIYAQILLGAWMRHTGAGLAIPDFPLAFGRLVPPFDSPGVGIHFAHRLGALVVGGLGGAVVAATLRAGACAARLRVPAVLLALLIPTQILLGGLTIWSARAVLPATLHVAIGSLALGVSFWGALAAFRTLPSSTRQLPGLAAIPRREPA